MGAIVRTVTGTASDEKCHLSGQRIGGIVGGERKAIQLEADASHQHTILSCHGCHREGGVRSKWISRDYMFTDYFTKAQQGSEFRVMRDFIMGVNPFEE